MVTLQKSNINYISLCSLKSLFHDSLVSEIVQNNHTLTVNNLTFYLPKNFGFCGGVKTALKMVDKARNSAIEKKDKKSTCYLLGEIIHNRDVNRFLIDQGVKIIPENNLESIFDIAGPDDSIIISAFGVDKDLTQRLKQKFKHNIIDAACANVKKVWTFVADQGQKGDTVILYGKPNHAEIKATISRALTPKNSVIVISNIEKAKYLATIINDFSKNFNFEMALKKIQELDILVLNPNFIDFKNLSLANQTTMLYSKTLKIEKILKNSMKGKGNLITCNTICRATQIRQDAALELCQNEPDIIIVAGGYESSNTTNLYHLAKEVRKTWFVENSGCIEDDSITHFIPGDNKIITSKNWYSPEYKKIGILAGASCPAVTVGDIIRKLITLYAKE